MLLFFLVVLIGICPGYGMSIPKSLVAGDTVMMLSPSSPPCQLGNEIPFSCPQGFEKNVEDGMAQYGLNVVWGQHCWAVDEYLAGDDKARASDIMAAFLNPKVKAIIATRGGNGAARMLHLLNFTQIAQNPKIVMGYSDVTVVLNSVMTMSGMVTFHGPMGLSNWTTNGPWWKSLVIDKATPVLKSSDPNLPAPYTITSGKGIISCVITAAAVRIKSAVDHLFILYSFSSQIARGKLIGGNLSLLTNILGSIYAPLSNFVGAILFIEDVDEPPYKIDRYLTQLEMFGVLRVVSGVVFGQCTSCTPSDPTTSFTIAQVLRHHLAHLKVPVFANAMFGHIDTQWTIPLGVAAEMDADAQTITLLEPAVQ